MSLSAWLVSCYYSNETTAIAYAEQPRRKVFPTTDLNYTSGSRKRALCTSAEHPGVLDGQWHVGKPLFACTVQKSDILNGSSLFLHFQTWEPNPQLLLAYGKAKVALCTDQTSHPRWLNMHTSEAPRDTPRLSLQESLGKQQTIGCLRSSLSLGTISTQNSFQMLLSLTAREII